MVIVFIRAIILYSLVVLIIRIMGKRQIGELQPYELVITIMISDLASIPMQDTKLPLLLGIVPIVTLLMLKILISFLELKLQKSRKIIDGEPVILIFKGKINYIALRSQQITIDELLEELRLAQYFDLEDVEYAILENNGKLSILESNLPKSKKKSPQLPKVLITDGKINTNLISKLNKDSNWIYSLLKQHNISSIKDVLIALLNTNGEFKYQLYNDYNSKNINLKDGLNK